MQHLQPNTTLQGGKYRIEKKARYLKVFLSNPADCPIIKNSISLLKSVKAVNITKIKEGNLTIHPISAKPDDKMKREVEQTLINYYSYAAESNISLKQTKRIADLLEKNSKEKELLGSAIESYNNCRYRHAFDDYRLCIEYYARNILRSNKTLENLRNDMLKEMKEKGFSTNLRSTLSNILSFFCDYQNSNVKHHNNISLIDTMTIFTWGNMILEQMIFLHNMVNWKQP